MTYLRGSFGILAAIALSACGNGVGDVPRADGGPVTPGVDTGPLPPTMCTGGRTDCGGVCRDVSNDDFNCGRCGNACADGFRCEAGACSLTCPAGQMRCDVGGTAICVNTTNDIRNCGMCGRTCAMGETCSGGVCGTSCGAGESMCMVGVDAVCANTQTDTNHCGGCGRACASGFDCVAGRCDRECAAGQSVCGDECVDLMTDNENCRECGRTCGAGRSCQAGECVRMCPTGQLECGGECVDTARSSQHCGMCMRACDAGQVCSSGMCQASCGAGEMMCGANCTNTANDVANCGQCGLACTQPSGGVVTCATSTCMPGCLGTQTLCGESCVDTAQSSDHCGRCNNACPTGQVCDGGSCVPAGTVMLNATPFKITGLSDVACNFLQHDTVTGDDHGGIALSSTRVFYSGDDGTGSFRRADLTDGQVLSVRWEAMLTDLSTNRVYVLADDTGPLSRPGGTVTQLIPLRADGRFDDSQTPLALSTPVPALAGSADVGLFSGWGNGYVYNTKVYRINFSTGAVTDLGNLAWPGPEQCESWTYHGLAESQGSAISFVFADPGFFWDAISRVNVSNGVVTEVFAASTLDFDDMCVIHAEPTSDRWYWKKEDDSFNEIVGFCSGTFTQSGSDFQVTTMTENNCTTLDVTSVAGDDDGGFAVTDTHVLYTGELATARMAHSLVSAVPVPVIHEALVTDIRSAEAYVLGDRGRPLQCGGGRISQLIPLDSSGRLTTPVIDLSDVIQASTTATCSFGLATSAVGIFAGYGGVAIHNGQNAYWVSLETGMEGQVRDLGPVAMPAREPCETWGYWGVAEFFSNRLHLSFVATDNTIKRIRIPEGTVENVATFTNIQDMCGFVINTNPSQTRWYWHHEYDSQLATGGTGVHPEFIGYCPASFTLTP